MEARKFDMDYMLLADMYDDEYYPKSSVDKVAALIRQLITFLEQGGHTTEQIQAKLDQMTMGINDLEEEFEQNDSEIETVARESIGTTVDYILHYFDVEIDIEEAIRERDW